MRQLTPETYIDQLEQFDSQVKHAVFDAIDTAFDAGELNGRKTDLQCAGRLAADVAIATMNRLIQGCSK